MRIHGYWGADGAPYVTARLGCSRLRISRKLPLLLDTGADRTTILDLDGLNLGINYQRLRRLEDDVIGVGGPVESYLLEGVRLSLGAEDEGAWVDTPVKEVVVVRHNLSDPKVRDSVMSIPSLLGRDVLNHYHIVLNSRAGFLTIYTGP